MNYTKENMMNSLKRVSTLRADLQNALVKMLDNKRCPTEIWMEALADFDIKKSSDVMKLDDSLLIDAYNQLVRRDK